MSFVPPSARFAAIRARLTAEQIVLPEPGRRVRLDVRAPALFVSFGSPLALHDRAYEQALRRFGAAAVSLLYTAPRVPVRIEDRAADAVGCRIGRWWSSPLASSLWPSAVSVRPLPSAFSP